MRREISTFIASDFFHESEGKNMKVKVRVKTSTFMKVRVETHLLLHQKGSESESISKSIYLCSIRIFHESESGDSSSCQTFQKHNFQLKVNLKLVFLKYDRTKLWIQDPLQ